MRGLRRVCRGRALEAEGDVKKVRSSQAVPHQGLGKRVVERLAQGGASQVCCQQD